MRMKEALETYFTILDDENPRLSIGLSRKFEDKLDDMFDNGYPMVNDAAVNDLARWRVMKSLLNNIDRKIKEKQLCQLK
jgi:hypothetical protein